MDAAGSADAGCCAAICIAITTSLESWCNLKAFGGTSNGSCCGGPRGCCGSCFEKSFEEDAFQAAERKAQAKEEKARLAAGQDGPAGAVDTQPTPAEKMVPNRNEVEDKHEVSPATEVVPGQSQIVDTQPSSPAKETA